MAEDERIYKLFQLKTPPRHNGVQSPFKLNILIFINKKPPGNWQGRAMRRVFVIRPMWLLTVLFFLLGFFICFFPDKFYELFFSHKVENIFFVRLLGLLLILAAFFYSYQLFNFKNNRKIIPLIIISKCLAVIFLLTNARTTFAPPMILLAALGDGTMALALGIFYGICVKEKYFYH